MHSTNGRTRSVWAAPRGEGAGQDPPLGESQSADVVVVGAGIAGVTTACLLAAEGKSVVVLDDGPAFGGESLRTTGHLNDYPDDGLREIESHHGTEGLKACVDSFAFALRTIERLAAEAGVPDAVRRIPAYLVVVDDGRSQNYLAEELHAAERIGYPLEAVHRAPTPAGPDGRALRMDRQGRLDAAAYFPALLTLARERGVKLYPGTRVADMRAQTGDGGEPDRGGTWVETRDGHRVNADWIVTATNSPVNPSLADLAAIHARQAGYMTYAVALDAAGAGVEDAQFSDTREPYRYARRAELGGREVLIAGGEDHKVGQDQDQDQDPEPGRTGGERFDRLEAWARSWWPGLGERTHAWSGQVFEPVDGVGFVGRNPGSAENSLIITGDSGQGLTHGTAGALIVTDRILGKKNPWARLYDPSRVLRSVTADLVTENADALAHYGQWLTAGDAKDADDIPVCGGATLREGVKKVCVHRDADGRLHRFSAACPHQNAVMHWNPVEGTWDCPVHASRFTALGVPINGPALEGMTRVD
ncbi:FAD-dependent oxidoreductase [Phycisphaera mikurensis]|uniref:Putative oxidoreductase n=1 Tax=Phycisphaera mikurensis (strain NBRC 102666 / KCTC 22515 / FYK2301M01) TaxID=1142394 RepID=I0ICF7_PHYMF|nr:FAD-dependent oxidoreductase [Phycisphaera mikurensis]MBB6442179.1 glycine/D-amino acid oxidase-like deaminating enzyme/nitrite reductase/ring-hydroxylating ferredoxin subunit [Phycisphaera mikurensis]BAM02945.1 putative oxidoreductase [Phycisphaera mikurensis NBRC 102666]